MRYLLVLLQMGFGAFAVVGVLLVGTAFVVVQSEESVKGEPAQVQDKKASGKYMGAEVCKNCHRAKDKGDAYGKWAESKHAKAYETLAGDTAKKFGKERGIDDPQKSEQCLKCHVTAYGVDKEHLGAKFDMKLGVQCETCHGPGEKHVKARMAAEDEDQEAVAAGEIERPTEKTCTVCHNKESPAYKEFKFEERKKEIDHSNPKKKKK